MNEKDLEIMEQYELQVNRTWRGRGSFLCDTEKGLLQLTEFSGSEQKLGFQNRVLEILHEQGENVDRILVNKEGSLVSKDKEGNRYVVKEWFDGKECDVRNRREVAMAVSHLAQLHKKLHLEERVITIPEMPDEEEIIRAAEIEHAPPAGEPLEKEFSRHNKELRRVRNFIQVRKQKNEFERRFLRNYDCFEEQGLQAAKELEHTDYQLLYERCLKDQTICHGDYNQHNVLFCAEGIVTVNFSRCCLDVQIGDFCRLFRKLMEKQNWSPQAGDEMINAYEKVRPMSRMEWQNFRLRLTYPEKFWKLANHYYNHKKTWMPEKNLQKLDQLIQQEKKRNEFLGIIQ